MCAECGALTPTLRLLETQSRRLVTATAECELAQEALRGAIHRVTVARRGLWVAWWILVLLGSWNLYIAIKVRNVRHEQDRIMLGVPGVRQDATRR